MSVGRTAQQASFRVNAQAPIPACSCRIRLHPGRAEIPGATGNPVAGHHWPDAVGLGPGLVLKMIRRHIRWQVVAALPYRPHHNRCVPAHRKQPRYCHQHGSALPRSGGWFVCCLVFHGKTARCNAPCHPAKM